MPTITTVELNDGKAPGAIQYMPPGEHVITPSINGQPQRVRVIVNKATAERLQADLENRLAAAKAGATRPCGYFDHKAGAASFIPTGFTWDDDKGVLLSVEWTNAGRAAIEGRDYSYFSPFVNFDTKTGEVLGMCSSAEIGSLVNDPAFPVERLAAARAELAPRQANENSPEMRENEDGINKTAPDMENIAKALGLDSDASEEAILAAIAELKSPKADPEKEAAFQKAVTDKETAEKERDEAKAETEKKDKELAAARAQIESLTTAAEDAFIDEQKRAGRIKPQDEAALAAARALFKADPAAARTAYGSMPGKDETTLAGGKTPGAPETVTREDIVKFYNS